MRVRPGLPLLLVLVLLVVTSSVSAGRVRRTSGDQGADVADNSGEITKGTGAAVADSNGEIQKGASRQQRLLFDLEFPKEVFRYYERPNFRYPYYNNNGEGALVYGYGDKYLYDYTVYKTFNGYYRRR